METVNIRISKKDLNYLIQEGNLQVKDYIYTDCKDCSSEKTIEVRLWVD